MKIAIIGTRGIPNFYGGFEQFAEHLSVGLVKKGHEVIVYNSDNHPFKKPHYKGVKLIHKKDPENKIGTAGQFIYDLNCIRDLKNHEFDIILQLGYTSSSVWGRMLPRKPIIVTNMDGLEWKRSKFSGQVQFFLKNAERWAIKTSDYWIADSLGIQTYLKHVYNVESEYIPYGAHVFNDVEVDCLIDYKLIPFKYNMLVARLEPENNIEVILDGIIASKSSIPFIVIGNHDTKYGECLKDKYSGKNNIRFIGGIYDQHVLSNIRYHCNLYFHGHSVGGTNPSLLEAMASNTFICSHDNVFNKSILGEDAQYFETSEDVTKIIKTNLSGIKEKIKKKNIQKIKEIYAWDNIINKYEAFFKKVLAEKGVTAKKKHYPKMS